MLTDNVLVCACVRAFMHICVLSSMAAAALPLPTAQREYNLHITIICTVFGVGVCFFLCMCVLSAVGCAVCHVYY